MITIVRRTALLLAALGVPSTATAQLENSSQDTVVVQCRGRVGAEHCGGRWLPEFAGYGRLGGGGSTNYRVGVSLGWTFSVGEQSAVGGSFSAMAHSGVSAALQARYRRFLEHGWVLDFGAGSVIAGDMDNRSMKIPSFVGDATILFKDWIGASVRVEHLRFEGSADTAVLFGGKVGRGLGILGYGVAVVGIAVAAATCC